MEILLAVSDSEQSYPTRPCQCLRRLTYWQLEAASQSRYYFEHKTCQTLLDNAKQQCDVDVKLDGRLYISYLPNMKQFLWLLSI